MGGTRYVGLVGLRGVYRLEEDTFLFGVGLFDFLRF